MKLPNRDLKHILHYAKNDLHTLKDGHILVTGGTGYIGRWLIEALIFANDTLSLNLTITVLSRDPERFKNENPYLFKSPAIQFLKGDVREFKTPDNNFSHLIHAATDVINPLSSLETFDVSVNGTKNTLEQARNSGVQHALLLSSGAVYGKTPTNSIRVAETYNGRPDTSSLDSAYGIGKIATEWLGTAYTQEHDIACKSARVFAQIGPLLALNKHFAAGNFIRDVLSQDKIIIKGDGTPLRSYMYSTDLVIWLLAILTRGQSGATYNVGSDHSISIYDLAVKIAQIAGLESPEIEVRQKALAGVSPASYVPDITLAKEKLNLDIYTNFDESLKRTINWFRTQRI